MQDMTGEKKFKSGVGRGHNENSSVGGRGEVRAKKNNVKKQHKILKKGSAAQEMEQTEYGSDPKDLRQPAQKIVSARLTRKPGQRG